MAGRLTKLAGEVALDDRKRQEATSAISPGLRSTGSGTEAGKAIVAQNGRKRQKGSLSVRQVRTSLVNVTAMVAEMADLRQSIVGQSFEFCFSQTAWQVPRLAPRPSHLP